MIKRLFKNKRIIFIVGDRKEEVVSSIYFVLKKSFKTTVINSFSKGSLFISALRNEVIIIKDNEKIDVQEIKNLLNDLDCSFVITQAEKKARIKKIVQTFVENFVFILDFSIAKKIEKKKKREILTFGINKKSAHFYITDIYQKEKETNFKVNYGGNTIPFWIQGKLNKKEIYAILPSLCIAKLFKLNFADISHRIKEEFISFTGK